MSWQNYVDNQLMGTGLVSKAVIAGLDGTLWAKSDNIEVKITTTGEDGEIGVNAIDCVLMENDLQPTREELVKLSNCFSDQEGLAMSGVHIGGEKYIYLSGTDQVIRCKKGKCGMHLMKTMQAVLVAMFEEPVQHPQVATIVETLGDYLISMSF